MALERYNRIHKARLRQAAGRDLPLPLQMDMTATMKSTFAFASVSATHIPTHTLDMCDMPRHVIKRIGNQHYKASVFAKQIQARQKLLDRNSFVYARHHMTVKHPTVLRAKTLLEQV
jgi:hypothetical protein